MRHITTFRIVEIVHTKKYTVTLIELSREILNERESLLKVNGKRQNFLHAQFDIILEIVC